MVKLSQLQSENRKKCQAFADVYINPSIDQRDLNYTFDRQIWKHCSELNLHGIFISKENGGLAYSLQDGMSFLESVGFTFRDNGLTFAAAAQLLSCTMSIEKYGREDQKKMLLQPIVQGKIVLAHAITEHSSGSDVFNMEGTYQSENNGIVNIRSKKTFCTNLPISDYVLCYVNQNSSKTTERISTGFLIPTKDLGPVETIKKMGLNTCLMGQTTIETDINHNQVLGSEGEGLPIFQEAITYERIGMSAMHLGTIERILSEAINWTNTRKVGQKMLSDCQAITHPLVDIHSEWTVLRTYLYQLCQQKLSYTKLYLNAAILKEKVSNLYVESCKMILQTYGGLGYTKNLEIERMMRDAMASKIYSGTSEVQKEIIWNYIS